MEIKSQKEAVEKLREKTKKISIIEASAYSVHEGFGIKYITPFALAIGKNNPQINTFIGLLTSIPSLIGNLSQLFTIKAIENHRRKNILTLGIILQAIMWWGVIFAGSLFFIFKLNSSVALTALILFYTLLILMGAFVGPAWVSLMKEIVTDKEGSYFGNRNRIAGIFAIISALIAGYLLDYLTTKDLFLGFVILFLIAFLFRFISGLLFTIHYEPKLEFDKSNYFSFYKFIKKIPSSNFGKFSLFISLFILATSIASPFFSVYMLRDLGFNYSTWMIITLAGPLSSLFFMPMWGYFADKFGNIKILKITGLVIPTIPILWIFSIFFNNSFYLLFYLIILEFFSGFLWAGFNLSYANFIYDAVTKQKTALCSAYFNILQGFGVFIGATLGGFISSLNIFIFGLSSLLFVFALSGIARFLSYILIIFRIKEIRDVKPFRLEELKKIHIKPFLDIFNLKIIHPRPNGN